MCYRPFTENNQDFSGTLGLCYLSSSLPKYEPKFCFFYRVGYHGDSLPEPLRMSVNDLPTGDLYKENTLGSLVTLVTVYNRSYYGREAILAPPFEANIMQVVGLIPPPSNHQAALLNMQTPASHLRPTESEPLGVDIQNSHYCKKDPQIILMTC